MPTGGKAVRLGAIALPRLSLLTARCSGRVWFYGFAQQVEKVCHQFHFIGKADCFIRLYVLQGDAPLAVVMKTLQTQQKCLVGSIHAPQYTDQALCDRHVTAL